MTEAIVTPVTSLRLAIASCFEVFVRVAAWVLSLNGKDCDSLEAALRGRLIGGSLSWRIGRNVRFHGPPSHIRLGHRVCFFGNIVLDQVIRRIELAEYSASKNPFRIRARHK